MILKAHGPNVDITVVVTVRGWVQNQSPSHYQSKETLTLIFQALKTPVKTSKGFKVLVQCENPNDSTSQA